MVVFSVTAASAHGPDGHEPRTEIAEAQAGERASTIVNEIIDDGRLNASWSNVEPTEIKKRTYDGEIEWLVIFRNEKEANPRKRMLYISLSLYGDYYGANHTGK